MMEHLCHFDGGRKQTGGLAKRDGDLQIELRQELRSGHFFAIFNRPRSPQVHICNGVSSLIST